MKKLQLRPYRHSDVYKWVIEVGTNGKRKREFFRTKDEGEAELERIKAKIDGEGQDALAFTDRERVDAIRALEKLRPFNRTLCEAADWLIEHLEVTLKSVTVAELITEHAAYLKCKKRSELHLTDLRYRLGRFEEAFGSRPVRTLSSKEIDQWVHSLDGLAPGSQNNYLSRIRLLLSFAKKNNYVDLNVLSGVEFVTAADEPVEIFTLEELTKLFSSAEAELVPYLAIAAFAGCRNSEIRRTDWKDVRGMSIVVAGSRKRGASRRIVEMEANLLEWLSPYRKPFGPIWKGNEAELHTALSALCERAGVQWKSNALRHSFCSYWLAANEKIEQLALKMGHRNTRQIDAHYREVVTREEGQAYFQLRPKAKTPGNVIPIKAAG